jgi:pyrimidine operon attenuation protein/uracil phosphoribosyltransferase
MELKKKAQIMTKDDISRAITRIAHEILEQTADKHRIAIVGIKHRGMYLAERIAAEIKRIANLEAPIGAMDITLYRDDLTQVAEQPVLQETDIAFDVDGKIIILVDDVLFTGRTVRCALSELIDFGRPQMIQLAVLIDRGHRELPIRPDYVGKSVPTSMKEAVQVKLSESDNAEEVVLLEKENS